jgi:DNA-binding SARP family transcriptional activator
MEGGAVAPLRVGVLGPVTVWHEDREISPGPPRQRALLGALATRAGLVVSREELIDALWGTAPPINADGGIYTYIAGLRKVLEPHRRPGDDPSVLVSAAAGYLLRLPPDGLDAASFAASLDRARALRASGDLAGAAATLRRGLALWRGTAFAGVPGPFADAERARLAELRTTAAEELADVLLASGQPEKAIPDLTALVAEHPLRERPRGLLMLALHGCGRQAEALGVYAEGRQVLAEELGLDPGVELDRIYEQVRGPVPAAPAAAPASAAPVSGDTVPAQVPMEAAGFAGRHAELDLLWSLLPGGDGQRAVPVALVTGTAGVGKTALAIRFARRVAPRFPDGQLYLNLRGFDPSGSPVEPKDALAGFFHALGVSPQRIPESLDGQVGLYRSLLAGKRILVVLDNARTAEQARPLLPASPGCMAVITSRSKLGSLVAAEGARPVSLDVLDADGAREVLSAKLGAGVVNAEPDAVDDLIRLCAGLPLALSVATARAATSPDSGLTALVAELRDQRQRLDALAIGDTTIDVRHVFSWSFEQLSERAARMFRLLGLHPGPDLTTPAAASLAGLPLADARAVLAELTGTSLLTEHIPGRFAFHDLLRAYATEQANSGETDESRDAARRRMFDYYTRSAQAATARLDPARDTPNAPAPREGVTPETFRSHVEALDWMRAEHAVLRALASHAFGLGMDDYCWQISWTMGPYLLRYAQRYEDAAARELSLAAASRSGDPWLRARSLSECACPTVQIVDTDQGHTMLDEAIKVFTDRGDRPYLSMAHHRRAVLLDSQDRTGEALPHAHEALRLRVEDGDPVTVAFAENALCWFYCRAEDFERARAHGQHAVNRLRGTGARADLADALDTLGRAYHGLGEHTTAVACYLEAISLYREAGNVLTEHMALSALGDAYLDSGDPESAARVWEQALAIADSVAPEAAAEIRDRLSSLDAVTFIPTVRRPA